MRQLVDEIMTIESGGLKLSSSNRAIGFTKPK